MQRDTNTGRFVREDKPVDVAKPPLFQVSYSMMPVFVMILYPWLVILANNWANIMALVQKLNNSIIDGIKGKEAL